jgi:hypothetical protein
LDLPKLREQSHDWTLMVNKGLYLKQFSVRFAFVKTHCLKIRLLKGNLQPSPILYYITDAYNEELQNQEPVSLGVLVKLPSDYLGSEISMFCHPTLHLTVKNCPEGARKLQEFYPAKPLSSFMTKSNLILF